MDCPNCSEGYIYGMAVKIPCPICNKTGILPDNTLYKPEIGQQLKWERLNIEKLTLQDFCKVKNINVITRSENERGLFREGAER